MSSVGCRIEFLQCEQYKGAGLADIFSRQIAIILTSTYSEKIDRISDEKIPDNSVL